MKNLRFVFIPLLLSIIIIFHACSKGGGGTSNPCAGVTISVSATVTGTSGVGATNGSISASASGSSGFTFSIDGTTFQSSGLFNNLAAGTYTIVAKNSNGCTGSASFTVANADICAAKTITVSGAPTNSDKCSNTGTITVTAGGSTGFTYQLNSGAFQAGNVFGSLAPGNYTVTVKDLDNCTKTSATISIGQLPAGPLFTAVKNIIQTNCAVSGCHNGTQAPNFTVDCNIVANASLIKTRAVDQAGTPNQMPQPPRAPLSSADQNAITAWVNAGGKYTD